MLVTDLIHSCSNDKVAQAAVTCIGGPFAERVRAAAGECGVSVGRFVAIVVRDFALRADDDTRGTLARRIAGSDQPILNGLRHVVEAALEDGAIFFDDGASDFGSQFIGRGLSCDGMGRLHRARLQAF
ncbi:MAG: hypothetical protein C3F11_10260 [Methylocystaceae bacterium]|nr:MAG: hypothetical protein C3F11_10260 [Methylocystaceae bacterium]